MNEKNFAGEISKITQKKVGKEDVIPEKKEEYFEFEKIKNKIVFRLVNYDKNKEALKKRPYFEFCDLAIVFDVVVAEFNDCCMTYRIDNCMAKRWKVSKAVLYDIAYINTKDIFGIELFSVNDLFQKVFNRNREEFESSELYAMTNKNMTWGAVNILYTDSLKQMADFLDSDLLILPSSVHEIILLKADPLSDTSLILRNMVQEINDTYVEEDEVLSYNIYYYNRNTNEISIG